MSTFNAQKPSLAFVAPTYNVCTATDKFAAVQGGKYHLHYKNGATPQASGSSPNKVTDNTSAIPPGSAAVAGFADLLTSAGAGMGATTESIVQIDNASRFIDGTGFVNLVHPGTLTTMTVAILGPL